MNNKQYILDNNLPKGFSFSIDVIIILLIINLLSNYKIIQDNTVGIIVFIGLYLLYSFIEYKYTTIGKFLLSQKVLNKDLTKPVFWKIFIRNIVKIPFFIFWLGILTIPLVWIIIIAMELLGNSSKNLPINKFNFIYDDMLGVGVYKKIPLGKEKPEANIASTKATMPLSKVEYNSKGRLFKIQKIDFKGFNSSEIIIVSIISGTIAFLLLGYIFGDTQNMKYSYQTGHLNSSKFIERTLKEFHFNYILAISGFIIMSSITYLFLNKRKMQSS